MPPPPPPASDGKTRVGLLLPLSGRSAEIGKAMLDAAQLALFDAGAKDMVLLPMDTGESPEGAAAAARNAVDQGARLIIGPLFGSSTRAVAPVARASGLNVISFSNDPAVAGDNVYLLGFTVQPQVQRVVEHAISSGMSRLAVIAPDSAYGQSVVQAMQDTAAMRGASVDPVAFYESQAPDVTPTVRAFAASARGTQAIMVPATGARLSTIVPTLAYQGYDPRNTKFLGTGLWDVPNIWREGGLLGAWFAVPPPEGRAGFEQKFNDTYGRRPPRLATLAYDAVALAAILTRNGGDFSAQTLLNPNGFAGVDGIFRFVPGGLNERGLAVMEITRDGVRTVSPAPTTFQRLTH